MNAPRQHTVTVRLLNAGGVVLREAIAPGYITAPLVLRWGEMTFLREGMRGAPLVDGDRYREVFCHDVPHADAVMPVERPQS